MQGFGFCQFSDVSQTDTVCSQLNGISLGGNIIQVQRSQQKVLSLPLFSPSWFSVSPLPFPPPLPHPTLCSLSLFLPMSTGCVATQSHGGGPLPLPGLGMFGASPGMGGGGGGGVSVGGVGVGVGVGGVGGSSSGSIGSSSGLMGMQGMSGAGMFSAPTSEPSDTDMEKILNFNNPLNSCMCGMESKGSFVWWLPPLFFLSPTCV